MKKIFSYIAVLAMIASMTACGNDDSSVSQIAKTTSAVTKTTTEETTEKATETTKNVPKASSEIAVQKLSDFFKIDNLLACGVETDDKDSIEVGGYKYVKVTQLDKISSIAELQELINNTCAGDLRNRSIESSTTQYVEKDGTLYALNGGRGSLYFDLSLGVTLSDVTDKSFTAKTNEDSALYGIGVFKFVLEDDQWLIESYDFETTEKDDSSEEEYAFSEDDMKDAAVTLMNNMTRVWKMFSGFITCDESDTIEHDGRTYEKVTDLGGFETVDMLKEFVDMTCTGSVRDDLYSSIDGSIIEKDGILYAYSPARGYMTFRTEDGVTLSDVTDDSFTATCNIDDEYNGKSRAHFVLVDGSFLMDDYKFE